MSRIKLSGLMFVLAIVSGCSWVEPFVDRRRNAGAVPERLYVGMSKPEAPVICYNGWKTEFDQLQKMADEECQKQQTGTRAEPIGADYFTCRLFTPAAYRFKCVNDKETESSKK